MGLHLGRVLFIILSLQAWTKTKGQQQDDFPKMNQTFYEFYEAEVQIADLNQNETAFAKEYYDDTEDMGRLDLLVYGEQQSVFYYNETGDLLSVNATSCIAKQVLNSTYGTEDVFYGWLYKNPLIIGPSALLWFAQGKPGMIKKGTTVIRGIKCDWYQLPYTDKKNNVTLDYYFADKTWTSPSNLENLRVPIRVDVNGITSEFATGAIPINQEVDFTLFRPIIDDFSVFEPPIGLGCAGRKTTVDLPDIPKQFRFVAEEYDLTDAEEHADSRVNFRRLFFDAKRQLARTDLFKRSGGISELHDFNTGVTYSIQDQTTCEIKMLAHSFFQDDGDDMFQGRMKTAKEVLMLNGDFYYMGTRTYRGLDVDVYESAQTRNTFFNNDEFLIVTTVFFTADLTDVVSEGENLINAPVYTLVTMYDKPNHVLLKKQYNIFAFNDFVGPSIYETFPIKNCFPLSQQKSYFVLILNDKPEVEKQIQNNSQLFIEEIKSRIMTVANVSDLRIPFLKIDYEPGKLFATGLMLDRPPVLKQFFRLHEKHIHTTTKLTLIPDALNEEQCAHACIDNPKCGVFHFCGEKAPKEGLCFHDKQSMITPIDDDDRYDFDNCYVYFRAEMNSNNKEEYLDKALEKFSSAVSKKDFKILIPMDDDSFLELIAADLIIGQGPYDRDSSERSYKLIFNGFELKPAEESRTSVEMEYVDTELECFRSCQNSETISCQSFSYCPQDTEKHCRISEEFLTKDANPKLLNANSKCNVYSLLYLDLFDPLPGKVLMRPGASALSSIENEEECALKCKKETSFKCRGFEYCKSKKSCVLHNVHIMDVTASEVVPAKDTKCVHYSARFSADYLNMGHLVIVESGDLRKSATFEECARSCSEDLPSCKGFSYCPGLSKEVSVCALTQKAYQGKGVETKVDDNCNQYVKKDDVKDWGKSRKTTSDQSSGYTKSSFTGLVFGMLIFGLIVGILGFVGYSYYRSRNLNDGMTVRFMKQTNA